jgi:hypothetical protein
MCSHMPSHTINSGHCVECGEVTNLAVDLEVWYYEITHPICASCLRLLQLEPHNPTTDGNIINGYNWTGMDMSPEQIAFEESMIPSGLLYSLADC